MKPCPDKLVGEIVQGRYAVLERTGPDRYKVYDMKELRQVELLRWDDQFLPLPSAPATAVARPPTPATAVGRAAPPPPPPHAARREPPVAKARPRTSTGRFEAAWFMRGEQIEQSTEEAEVTDYVAYQKELEAMAANLDERRPLGLAGGTSLTSREQRPIVLFALPDLC